MNLLLYSQGGAGLEPAFLPLAKAWRRIDGSRVADQTLEGEHTCRETSNAPLDHLLHDQG